MAEWHGKVNGSIALSHRRFLEGEILLFTLRELATRSMRVYKESVNDKQRQELKDFIRVNLPKYAVELTENKHIQNIQQLSDALTERFSGILINGRFRIGVSQKILNLYLKYCWSCGWISEPPHCPFDRIVISMLGLPIPLNWTELDSIEHYLLLVEAARRCAQKSGLSIAVWELQEWQRRSSRSATLNS